MVTDCEIRAYAKGAAYFSIAFCFPYVFLSAFLKKSNPKAFRYSLVVPTLIAFHTLTYIPRDLQKCEMKKRQQQQQQTQST